MKESPQMCHYEPIVKITSNIEKRTAAPDRHIQKKIKAKLSEHFFEAQWFFIHQL